jgi:predicted Zn-dependent peptidase
VKALLIAAALFGTASQPTEPFRPDTVVDVPGGPRMVIFATPGSPRVALRLSVPVNETPARAGAAEILRVLAEARMTSMAALVGADVAAARTPWSIAYTVTGAVTDLDHLAAILVAATDEPDLNRVDFSRARNRLRDEVARDAEIPGRILRSRLLERLAPDRAPHQGTFASLDRMTQSDVLAVWSRTHRREHMALVVAGPLPVEAVLAAIQPLGRSTDRRGQPNDATMPSPERQRAQVFRSWYGIGVPAGPTFDPHAAVASLLLGDRVSGSSADYQIGVELWELGDGHALVVTGAAYGNRVRTMQNRVRGLIAETEEALTGDAVSIAVARVKKELLLAAGTQEGLIRVAGRHLDASGNAYQSADYMEALGRVDASSMASYMERLREVDAVTVEVRP